MKNISTFILILIIGFNFSVYCQEDHSRIAIDYQYFNIKEKKAFIKIKGKTFSTEMETDWRYYYPGNEFVERGAYPKNWTIYGKHLPNLKFGFNKPWEYIYDLDINETENGLVTISKGYKSAIGTGCLPYIKSMRTFWNESEMVYEVTESKHIEDNKYYITTSDSSSFKINTKFNSISYYKDDIVICWQFSPSPKSITFEKHTGYVLSFDSDRVETLISWGKKDNFKEKKFVTLSNQLSKVNVHTANGEKRIYDASQKHLCVEPGESLQLPNEEYMLSNVDKIIEDRVYLNQGLHEFVVRNNTEDRIEFGNTTLFSLNTIINSKSIPDIKHFLVRSLRSLNDRIIFGVVTEDDPTQGYLWGAGTWPRCFSILSLDYFGFNSQAYNYLEYMIEISKQFKYRDRYSHLWDSFHVTGDPRYDMYDINGHSIKLFEAGKFYIHHRNDEYGKKILDEHYETLKDWCLWIEKNTNERGLIEDQTESNIWSYGYGSFTQAPSIAGIKLFVEIAKDKKQKRDVKYFTQLANKLLDAMNQHLYGDCENRNLNIGAGKGESYTTYIPSERSIYNNGLGLSCYSLAPHFFLLDPDVKLLDKDNEKITSTLNLALELLGDDVDKRIITWHVQQSLAHIGYGQGQLLMALLYTKNPIEFNYRLDALFDITKKEPGDQYLIPELLGRASGPNKGNKAHLTYYPFMIAYLGGLSHSGEIMKDFISDLEILKY